jgi:hypothetical protein
VPPNADRAKKAPVALLAVGIRSACTRQVDLARFWIVRQESPRRVARFLEHHIPAGLTGASGLGTDPDPDPDTYTFFVYPKGEVANLNELFFTITAVGTNSTGIRADGIGSPLKAGCYIK